MTVHGIVDQTASEAYSGYRRPRPGWEHYTSPNAQQKALYLEGVRPGLEAYPPIGANFEGSGGII